MTLNFGRNFILFVVFFSIFGSPLGAQSSLWQRIGGPLGGIPSLLVTNPNGSELLAGGEKLYRTADHADSWQQMTVQFGLRSLCYGIRPGELYSAGFDAFRSSDNGQSWHEIPGEPFGTHYLAFISAQPESVVIVSDGLNLIRSTDNGQNWPEVIEEFGHVYAMARDSSGGLWTAAGGGFGLKYSADTGRNWQPVLGGLLDSALINALYVGIDRRIYAAGYHGMVLKLDYGSSEWKQVNPPLRASSGRCDQIIGLAIDSMGRIYAQTTGNEIYRRDRGSASQWQNITAGLPPVTLLSVAVLRNGDVFAGTYHKGVYRSTDQGATWRQRINGWYVQEITALATTANGTIIAGTNGYGVFVSKDHGEMWQRLEGGGLPNWDDPRNGRLADVTAIATPDSLGTMFLALNTYYPNDTASQYRYNDIFRSKDGGNTWMVSHIPSPSRTMTICTGLTPTILAGTSEPAIFLSGDTSDNWQRSSSGLISYPGADVNSIVATPNKHLFALQAGRGVFRSIDSGNSWQQINNGITDLNVSTMATDGRGALVIAGRHTYRSTDDGNSWSDVGAVHDGSYVVSNGQGGFAMQGWLDTVKAILHSNDRGGTWHTVPGLDGVSLESLAMDVEGYIYYGGGASGLFRTTQRVTSVASHAVVPTKYFLSQNYPNPFNPTTVISYSLPTESHVTIKLYNVLGQLVKVLVDDTQPLGEKSIRLEAPQLASGVYFYELRAGQYHDVKKLVLAR